MRLLTNESIGTLRSMIDTRVERAASALGAVRVTERGNMAELAFPTTRYARSGESSIAYQVTGDGSVDLIVVPGMISDVESCTNFRRIRTTSAVFQTLHVSLTFDKRGQGLSDRESECHHYFNNGWMM